MRDGEREIEVSGAAPFVRQVLDDLPVLLARLRGEAPPTPAAIRMPQPSPEAARAAPPAVEASAVAAVAPSPPPDAAPDGNGAELEARVLAALRSSTHPLAVAGIRNRLGLDVTGQQVRRILERAGSKVVATGDRPIRYRMR